MAHCRRQPHARARRGAGGPDRITKNVYDDAGQLLQVRHGVGTSVEAAGATYAYRPNGRKQYVIDGNGNGNRAQYTYDGLDRLARWYFPSTTRSSAWNDSTPVNALSTAGSINSSDYEEYGYDPAGNRTSLRKRDGSTLTYTYDALSRVIVRDSHTGSILSPASCQLTTASLNLALEQIVAITTSERETQLL